LLGAQEEKAKPRGPKVVHLSTSRFDILSKLSAALIAVGFVLAPVFILFLANLGREKMAVVVGIFVLVFLLGASLVVDLTVHEIFVFIVAYVLKIRERPSSLTLYSYSAILVTLLSNFLQAKASGGSPQWSMTARKDGVKRAFQFAFTIISLLFDSNRRDGKDIVVENGRRIE
jgi:hypothetical protein